MSLLFGPEMTFRKMTSFFFRFVLLKTTNTNKKQEMSFKYSQGFFAMNVENIFSLNFGSIRLEYMK